MVPIVFALVPTIIGAGLLVGLNSSGNKGVLLFGNQAFCQAMTIANRFFPSRVPGRHFRQCSLNDLRVQR